MQSSVFPSHTMHGFLSSSCVTSIHALHMLMRCIYASSIHALYSIFFKWISQVHLFMHCILPVLPCVSILFILHSPFSSPDFYPALTSAQFFHPTLFSLKLCFSEIARSFPEMWALLTLLCSDIRLPIALDAHPLASSSLIVKY